ncbi:MAG: insulinase family protein [Kofleriaceae bacterium]
MMIRTIFVVAAVIACGPKAAPTMTTNAPPPPGPGSAASVQPPVPTGDDAPLPLWPQVKRGTLPNGLTYYVLKHGKPEKRAFMWLAVNAGAVQEDDDQRGLAHFLEHMAFNGTKRFPKAALIEYLENIGMRFGADLNAYTSFDQTVYQLEVPTDKPEFLDKGFEILRDWSADLTIDPAEVEKERGVVLEEWRLRRGAGQRLFEKQIAVLYEGTRYPTRLPIGEPEILRKAPRDTLARFYKDWYRPDLMAVIVVGDFDDPAAIEKQITSKFGDLTNPKTPRVRPGGGVPKATGTRILIETDKEQPGQSVAVYNTLPHRPELSAKDFRRSTVEQLYRVVITERLGIVGRRPDAPFSSAFAGPTGLVRDIDAFTRSAQVRAGKVEDALASLFLEVLRIEKHGILQSELDRARTNLARRVEQSAVEAKTTHARGYLDELTRAFFEHEYVIGREAERDLTLRVLPTVSLAELNLIARSFGGADNRVVVIVGPEGKPLPTKDRVLAIMDEVGKRDVLPWADKAAATTLLAKPPVPGKVVSETRNDAVGVLEWKLSNGARVIVKPTDFEADTVIVDGQSPGGLATASAALYRHARFADDLARVGGAGEHDVEGLGKVLAGKDVSVSTSISETVESINGRASVRDLETMFQLLYLRISQPRKDLDAIAVWRGNLAEQYENRERDPEFQFSKKSSETLWRGHVRRKPPTPAEIGKVDADKALAFYKTRFGDASDFTFVIVGNVDPTALKPLVESYLASLPAKGRSEHERDVGARRIAGAVTRTWGFGQEQKARVSMTFHGDEAWTRDKERDAYVLGRVLSILLRENLRENLGGVYGVSAGGAVSRRPRQERTFSISFGCDPARIDELVKATEAEVAALVKSGVKPEILDRVNQTFLRERETQLRNNTFWANWLQTAARYGDDPALVLDPAPTTARMTSDLVKATAKRFLDGRRVYRAVLVPAGAARPTKPAARKQPAPPKDPKLVPGAEAEPNTVPGAEKP